MISMKTNQSALSTKFDSLQIQKRGCRYPSHYFLGTAVRIFLQLRCFVRILYSGLSVKIAHFVMAITFFLSKDSFQARAFHFLFHFVYEMLHQRSQSLSQIILLLTSQARVAWMTVTATSLLVLGSSALADATKGSSQAFATGLTCNRVWPTEISSHSHLDSLTLCSDS